ncbi:hypothetical protein D2T29_03645 [Sinirhodobacter populi]|uniref:Transposase IS116/IS110/IS902 C-terminal domain-containing protein n=1 Tax=Paenirhodobacter populi TaxID=2306993 RepID=A0A443KP81_9RHOB|nr:hypothetical protein D2T29_03645 [Sinirhodobacter populi]
MGLVPAEHSTGGKQILLGISKRGNRYVRCLIIHGARSCFLHLNRANHAIGRWLSAPEARTHRNKAVVAIANKLIRIVWAMPHFTNVPSTEKLSSNKSGLTSQCARAEAGQQTAPQTVF